MSAWRHPCDGAQRAAVPRTNLRFFTSHSTQGGVRAHSGTSKSPLIGWNTKLLDPQQKVRPKSTPIEISPATNCLHVSLSRVPSHHLL